MIQIGFYLFKKMPYLFVLALLFTGVGKELQAQKISLTANIRAIGVDKVGGLGSTSVTYQGTTEADLHARLFNKNRWAIRLGLGAENLRYTIKNNDFNIDNTTVLQQNLKAYFGLEKHFKLGGVWYPYAGLYMPVAFSRKDCINDTGYIPTSNKQLAPSSFLVL